MNVRKMSVSLCLASLQFLHCLITTYRIPELDLDHTADVQCHCWGRSVVDAFANMAPCMFNYITDLTTVLIDPKKTIKFTVKGRYVDSIE